MLIGPHLNVISIQFGRGMDTDRIFGDFQDTKGSSRDYVASQPLGRESIEYWQTKETQSPRKPQEASDINKRRDLIKEYFARNRNAQEPPPIFRSQNGKRYPAYFPSQQPEDEYDLQQVLDFVDENFKEINISSVIVPETVMPPKSEVNSGSAAIGMGQRNPDNGHLIGKINPNILRTWEQLNLCQSNDRDYNVISAQEPEDMGSFKVNYVTYDRAKLARNGQGTEEDLFYDSIDEEDQDTSEIYRSNIATFEMSTGESIIYRGEGGDQRQSSLMTDSTDQYLMGSPMTGGNAGGREGMAEFDSLIKKQIKVWSAETMLEF